MTIASLRQVFDRAQRWPDDDQQKLARAAELIEAQHQQGYELAESDWQVIDDRVKLNDIASGEDTTAFFAKYRQP